jgi:hypothetical protein
MLEPLLELLYDFADVLFVDSIYPLFYLGLFIPKYLPFVFLDLVAYSFPS